VIRVHRICSNNKIKEPGLKDLLFREDSIYITEGNFDEKTVFADVGFGMPLAAVAVFIQEDGQNFSRFCVESK
jgi:hypothetical protein